MSFSFQEIIDQMTRINAERRRNFDSTFSIYESNPFSFEYMDEAAVAAMKVEIQLRKTYMREQENLLSHLKFAQAKSITDVAQALTNSWANDVDRQGGSFTAEELDPNRGRM